MKSKLLWERPRRRTEDEVRSQTSGGVVLPMVGVCQLDSAGAHEVPPAPFRGSQNRRATLPRDCDDLDRRGDLGDGADRAAVPNPISQPLTGARHAQI